MQLISVNVGLPRTVTWKGERVTTVIFKEPVAGHVRVRRVNLEGDRQADLTVHGGVEKAVYAYPMEHYAYWRDQLPAMDLPWGMFGENLTTAGLLEAEINIGDRFRAGTAELIVTEPRVPCYKLGVRFGRADMVKRFLRSGRSGFYFAVEREGELCAGDTIERLSRDPHGVTVADVARLYVRDEDDLPLLRRAVEVEALSALWRNYFRERIAALS